MPLDLLARPLAAAELTTVRPDRGEPLPSPSDVDSVLVLGGTMSAYDDAIAPWLPDVRRAMRDWVAADIPVLGICLGAQLLAVAFEGEMAAPAPAGSERGLVDIRLRPDAGADPLLAAVVDELGRDVLAPSSHDDAVSVLPEGATWLASSRQYPYQAFRVGSAWGLQFHPEAGEETLAAWQAKHDRADGDGVDHVTPLRERYRADADRLGRLATLVGDSFVALASAHAGR